jgi:hypothetical protein
VKLSMRNGVLLVEEKHGDSIEIEVVDGELVIYGDDVTIEELEDEDGEEVIEFEDEPDKPTNAFAHLEDRVKPYDVIEGLVIGDKVRLRQDLTWKIDNVIDIGLVNLLIEDLEPLDSFEVERVTCSYDEHSEKEEPEIYSKGWNISTRWIEKVEE